eukprot:1131010-Pyramimonas_sp.AAC.2
MDAPSLFPTRPFGLGVVYGHFQCSCSDRRPLTDVPFAGGHRGGGRGAGAAHAGGGQCRRGLDGHRGGEGA